MNHPGRTFSEMSEDAVKERLYELEAHDPDNLSDAELADFYEEQLNSSSVSCTKAGCSRTKAPTSRWCVVCEIEYLHVLKEMEAKGHVIVDPTTKGNPLWATA